MFSSVCHVSHPYCVVALNTSKLFFFLLQHVMNNCLLSEPTCQSPPSTSWLCLFSIYVYTQNFKYFCKMSCVTGERKGCGCVNSRRDDGLRSTAFGELSVGLTTVTAVDLERQLNFLFVLSLHKPHYLASLLVVFQV